MPKEVIHGDANQSAPLAVQVGWWKDYGVVQVASVDLSAPEGSDDPAHGLHCDLTRAAINDLIRVLRRARDQAFGKDE